MNCYTVEILIIYSCLLHILDLVIPLAGIVCYARESNQVFSQLLLKGRPICCTPRRGQVWNIGWFKHSWRIFVAWVSCHEMHSCIKSRTTVKDGKSSLLYFDVSTLYQIKNFHYFVLMELFVSMRSTYLYIYIQNHCARQFNISKWIIINESMKNSQCKETPTAKVNTKF